MKKKLKKSGLILLIMIIFLISCFAGVYAMNGVNIFNEVFKMGDGFVKENSLNDIINASVAGNDEKNKIEQSANKLITKVYNRNDFVRLAIRKDGELVNSNCAVRTLFEVNQRLPIECLRKVNEDLVYVVYKIITIINFSN